MPRPQLVNWLGAVSQVTGDAALMAFTCPGTQAALYKSCKSASDAGVCFVCVCAWVCAGRGCDMVAVTSRHELLLVACAMDALCPCCRRRGLGSMTSNTPATPHAPHDTRGCCCLHARAGAKGICNALPGCAFVPVVNECLPKALDGKRVADVQALDQAFKAADAAVWGNCEGSCYIRQVRALVRGGPVVCVLLWGARSSGHMGPHPAASWQPPPSPTASPHTTTAPACRAPRPHLQPGARVPGGLQQQQQLHGQAVLRVGV